MSECPVDIAELKHDRDTSWSSAEEEDAYHKNLDRRITEAVDEVLGSESEEDISFIMETVVAEVPEIRNIMKEIWSIDTTSELYRKADYLGSCALRLNRAITINMRKYVEAGDE